jgi:adenylate cyclase
VGTSAKPVKGSEEWWVDYLTHGHQLEGMARWLFPKLPSAPRCKICKVPFNGFGKVFSRFGWAPSRKNPKMCGFCSDRLPIGGADVQVAILVVDVRGYTTLSETMNPTELVAKLNSFFNTSTDILMHHDALIDKYLGDAVQALFLPGVAGDDYLQCAFEAGSDILTKFKDLPIGVTIHSGICYVGNVGSDHIVDLTAMGDVVNTTHRLQSSASEGTMVVSSSVYHHLNLEGWEKLDLDLKGKAESFSAFKSPKSV